MTNLLKTSAILVCCILLCVSELKAGRRRRLASKLCKVTKQDFNAFKSKFKCSNNGTQRTKTRLYEESLCPWYYKIDYDPDRHPATIERAIPLTQYCIGSNNRFECVKVTKELRGYRKSDCKDKYNDAVWTEITIRQVVGFTCSRRAVVEEFSEDYS